MAQEYISEVSEEVEGRGTKKLSKEFSGTESRILGALSKLDEFLLNRQVRTCSVAVPGTSGNSNSENREPTGDRSLDDPCPKVGFSSHHSGNVNSPEMDAYPHTYNQVCFMRTHRSLEPQPMFEKQVFNCIKTTSWKFIKLFDGYYSMLLSQNVCKACGQTIPAVKDIPGPSSRD